MAHTANDGCSENRQWKEHCEANGYTKFQGTRYIKEGALAEVEPPVTPPTVEEPEEEPTGEEE